MTSQILSSALHLDDWTRYFRQTQLNSKKKKDSNVIKSPDQCSLEKSHAVLIELNSEL